MHLGFDAALIEQAEFDACRVFGIEREVDAGSVPGCALRVWLAWQNGSRHGAFSGASESPLIPAASSMPDRLRSGYCWRRQQYYRRPLPGSWHVDEASDPTDCRRSRWRRDEPGQPVLRFVEIASGPGRMRPSMQMRDRLGGVGSGSCAIRASPHAARCRISSQFSFDRSKVAGSCGSGTGIGIPPKGGELFAAALRKPPRPVPFFVLREVEERRGCSPFFALEEHGNEGRGHHERGSDFEAADAHRAVNCVRRARGCRSDRDSADSRESASPDTPRAGLPWGRSR